VSILPTFYKQLFHMKVLFKSCFTSSLCLHFLRKNIGKTAACKILVKSTQGGTNLSSLVLQATQDNIAGKQKLFLVIVCYSSKNQTDGYNFNCILMIITVLTVFLDIVFYINSAPE